MNKVIPFQYGDRSVRTIVIDGEPHFVARDVCDVLGINKHRDAVSRLDDDERESVTVDTLGGRQSMAAVNESGLYSLVLRSQKPEARMFKRWITHEVLPSIRKHGRYQQPESGFYIPDSYAAALRLAADQQEQLEAQRPAVEFFKAVADSTDAISIGDAAKTLNMGIGRNKMFALLRQHGVLMSNNLPYQKYIDLGWFRVIEQAWTDKKGKTHPSFKPVVYQRGLDGIRRLLQKELVR